MTYACLNINHEYIHSNPIVLCLECQNDNYNEENCFKLSLKQFETKEIDMNNSPMEQHLVNSTRFQFYYFLVLHNKTLEKSMEIL